MRFTIGFLIKITIQWLIILEKSFSCYLFFIRDKIVYFVGVFFLKNKYFVQFTLEINTILNILFIFGKKCY